MRYGFAYRVLDAQFWGVAQRRRRVFVVGHLGDWRRAAAVLFDAASLSGSPAPSREAGKGVAGTLEARFGSRDRDNHGTMIPHPHADISPALKARDSKGVSSDGDGDGAILVPMIAFDTTQITSKANRSNPQPGDPCHPLAAGAHAPAIAFDCKASGQNGFGVGEIASTQRAMGHTNSRTNGGGHQAVLHGMQVRRLTPRECERLQGFPDDYTLIPYRGKPAKDGPRYKALGNSMAVPVMSWIGRRIQMVGDVETLRRVA